MTARKALQMSLNVPGGGAAERGRPGRAFSPACTRPASRWSCRRRPRPGLAIGLGGLGITLHGPDPALCRAGARRRRCRRSGVRPGEPAAGDATLTDPVSAWYVADILRGAPPPDNALPGRIAFKTGTSYGYRDAWALGFDRRHTVGVWVGRPDGSAVPGLVGRDGRGADPVRRLSRGSAASPSRCRRPPEALVATTATLPPPLRHVRKDVPKTMAVDACRRP